MLENRSLLARRLEAISEEDIRVIFIIEKQFNVVDVVKRSTKKEATY